MTDETKKDLRTFLAGVSIGAIPVSVAPYPMGYEPMIQTAVRDKRSGNYDLAISMYLAIFEHMACGQTEIMRFLYKVLLCDEELGWAFETISLAERALKQQLGSGQWGMPWAQTVAKRELVAACSQVVRGNKKVLFDYIYDMAGNPNYSFCRGDEHLLKEAEQVLKLYSSETEN